MALNNETQRLQSLILAITAALTLGALALVPSSAAACGAFMCSGGGTGPTPIVQAAERVIFEQRQDGTVRAYVQIRYDQAGGPPVGFSWVIPVLSIPEVGIAEAATFDQLDQATAPQFRFVNNARPVASGGGGACSGSEASADRLSGAEGGTVDVSGVTVWGATRVGDYETATISGETSDVLIRWLEANGYDIPAEAGGLIEQYVVEGHLFVAFKYAPLGEGSGALDPIVLTYVGVKPCIPIRITAVASTPILDIMVLALGQRRAAPEGAYYVTEPDYDAVRPDGTSAAGTTYSTEVARVIDMAGGKAFVTEYAAPTDEVGAMTDLEAQALLARNDYITRFYTRMRPEDMTLDPEFVFPGGSDVARFHVVDITPDFASAPRTSTLSYAVAPSLLMTAVLAFLFWRRRD